MLHAADESAQPAVAMAEGEVGKIDRDALKVGDKKRFIVERMNRVTLVTWIETQDSVIGLVTVYKFNVLLLID